MQKRRGSRFSVANAGRGTPPRIVRLTTDPLRPVPLRKSEGFVSRDGYMPEGFSWQLLIEQDEESLGPNVPEGSAAMFLPVAFEHLGNGDVVRLDPERGAISVLFQGAARHNSILLTERCNHYCLMCSQPPRNVNDDWIFDDVMQAIPLIDPNTQEIGFTGGEPTLLGERLVRLAQQCESYLPGTSLHILTNGRAFVDEGFARAFAAVEHHDLMFGIPIYSDLSEIHDYIVQSDGAFDDTLGGVINLKAQGLAVEIRVVVHKQTAERLPDLARFIARNLTFVDQVVFMGLEITGFTKANMKDLWIDPVDYQPQLFEAVQALEGSRIGVGVYNHQLCVTDRRLWKYARRSISDWKNEYLAECGECAARKQCGGFFSSTLSQHSAYIQPISNVHDGFA